MKQYKIAILAAGVISMMASCKKDFSNPNRVVVDAALSTPAGMTNVAIGLQRSYSTTRVGTIYNAVCANGFSTYELSNRNTGNVDETNLAIGGSAVDGSNNILGNLWATNLKVIFDATRVISAAEGLGDKNFASGLIAYTTIFKAMAQGSLAEFWEKVPDTAGVGLTINFVDRMQGYKNAIGNIDKALGLISANAPSTFIVNSLPAGINFTNSLQALKARYALFSGNYSVALAAANAVDLTSRSEMRFDAQNPNPIFSVSTSTNNVFQVLDSTFGLPIDLRPDFATDRRIGFYMIINTGAAPRWRISGFGAALTTPWPVYVPGEVTLTKAECLARAATPDLAGATAELNKVLIKTAASDPFGIGAGQTAYAGANTAAAILTEIYRQRCIELYMHGFKMEDQRRFGRSNAPNVEKKRNLFPYPFRERDNNVNTPADPTF